MTGETRAELIARAATRMRDAGVPDAERDARLLLRWAAGMTGAALSAAIREIAGADETARFEAAVEARAVRVPVSQITGQREFWGRTFRVTRDVLDPRPETETLIAEALAGPVPGRILDLGTGSGCILLTLLAEWPEATGVGTDISAAALMIARENAARLGLANRAAFCRGDWFSAVDGQYDLIVSNPPYIAEAEIAALSPEVRLHEPREALTPGGDGLGAYRAIAAGAALRLVPGGRLIVEIGPDQGEAVCGILAAEGFGTARIARDLDGRDRVIVAHLPTKTPDSA